MLCVCFFYCRAVRRQKHLYKYVNNKEAIARSCDQSDGNGRSQIAEEIISFVRVMEDT